MGAIETISSTQKKFSFSFVVDGSPNFYNVYINHDENIPDNRFVWDYFSTGELYLNMNLFNLTEYKDVFSVLYTSYFLTGKISNPDQNTTSSLTFATVIPYSDYYAWAFDLSTFFEYEKIAQETPICEYMTISHSGPNGIVIRSSHYKFANIPNSYTNCSHPHLTANNPIQSCHYIGCNSNCPVYSPLTKVVHQRRVNKLNSSSFIDFQLTYSQSDRLVHIFQVKNLTDSLIVNTIRYPQDIQKSYDELLSEAMTVFDQYLEAYIDPTYTTIQLSSDSTEDSFKDEQKPSYIASLLGV